MCGLGKCMGYSREVDKGPSVYNELYNGGADKGSKSSGIMKELGAFFRKIALSDRRSYLLFSKEKYAFR